MNRYDKEVSNLSYTNKDFNSIYTELLDLADRISPKWKPSLSNESDPGALLIKLDALIGDKNNYNIDKNILELFPSSVTQYPNAREVFEQCGYTMPYYRAAEVVVSINMTSEPEGAISDEASSGTTLHKDTTRLYTLPDFTMITNDDNSVVYTIIDNYPFLTSDRVTYAYTALQGGIKDYTLNNSLLVTYNSLDYNNRLYFKEPNIAENGIFITNVVQQVEAKNYSDWVKVDNILTQAPNTLCYKFGVSKDGSQCYIEFPTDIANLIGEGLHIKYITTAGYEGNISDKVLSSFFGDIESNVTIANNSLSAPTNRYENAIQLTITNDNVYIRNILASSNGRDPETIEEARVNYERTKNTFETLVSLRDYNNFLLTSDQVSNGFICDRSNDVQASSKIVTTTGELESVHTQVREKDSEPELSPFDLRIYALKYVYPANTETRFDLTFELADSEYLKNIQDDMADIKCIQHDFKELNEKEIIMIQLRFPIYAKIIPYNKLETLQQLEIQSNVRNVLFESLNSGKLVFGEEIDYDSIYDTIMESDNRIKSLILDDFDYTAHIIYRDGDNINSYEIPSKESIEQLLNKTSINETEKQHIIWLNTIRAKAILSGVTPLLEKPDFNFNYSYLHQDSKIYPDAGKVKTESKLTLTVDSTTNKASVSVKENESIYLTTNNYITKETYTNYVKYFYKINSRLQPDELHELVNDEFVAFFWKESDEDDSYYYTKFKNNGDSDALRIMSPSFVIKSGTTAENYSPEYTGETQFAYQQAQTMVAHLEYSATPQKLNKVVPATFNYTSNDGSQQKQFTASDLIAKCDTGTILSGTKSIQIKDKNTITFDKTSRLYWLRNNSENKDTSNEAVYYLFKDSPLENGRYAYTLKTGEYLFYSDREGRTFSMLGPGTKLDCEASAGLKNISVKARDYEEILYGANNLLNEEDLWYIPTAEIVASEMMFYNIGSDTTVHFELPELTKKDVYGNSEQGSITVTSSYVVIDSESIKIKYELEDSLADPDKISKDYEYDAIVDDKILTKKSLSNVVVSYTYQGTTTELPRLSISDAVWAGRSYLNLNCGHNKEQVLYCNTTEGEGKVQRKQSIVITKKLNKSSGNNYTFEPTDINPSNYPTIPSTVSTLPEKLIIQTNYNIELLGGEDVDITAFDLNAVKYNNAFYTYTKPDDTNEVKTSGEYVTEVELQHDSATKIATHMLKLNYPPSTLFSEDSTEAYLLPIVTLKDYEDISVSAAKISSVSPTDNKYTLNAACTYEIKGALLYYDEACTTPVNADRDGELLTSFYITGISQIYMKSGTTPTVNLINNIYELTTVNNSELKEKGIKFFAFIKDTTKTINPPSNLVITVKNKSVDLSNASKIRVLPIVPYLNEAEIGLTATPTGDVGEVQLHAILKSLDSEHKFNYIHEVKSDVLIENPWNPYSFLDKNHPYNHATICRWDYDDSTIKITNKIK